MPVSDCYSILINSSDNNNNGDNNSIYNNINNYNHETTVNEFLTNWTTSFLRYEDCLYANESGLLENASNIGKNRTHRELPEHLRFNSDSLSVVIVYSVLFIIAAVGNLSVFTSLIRRRPRNSRMSLLIINLTVADLVVTFFMIPLEIGWRITTQWLAGDIACKVFLFLRAFGLYLSSNVLVCVSMDRYFAVLHPLKVTDSRRRGKLMLCGAWFFSCVCAMPQSVIFHLSQHPEYPEFWQCVSFDYFSSQAKETAYNLFCVCAMYFFPLIIICFAYSCILCEISKKTKENKDIIKKGEDERCKGKLRLRRSDITYIERARSRTMCLSVTIVLAFVWCWTPYVVMTLWYMFDRNSAETVNSTLQDGLFIMAVSNSCVNPLVYGSYAVDFRCCRLLKKKDSRMSTVRSNGTTRTTVFRTPSYRQRCNIPLSTMNHRPVYNGNTNKINYLDLPNSSCELHSDSDHLPDSLRLVS